MYHASWSGHTLESDGISSCSSDGEVVYVMDGQMDEPRRILFIGSKADKAVPSRCVRARHLSIEPT